MWLCSALPTVTCSSLSVRSHAASCRALMSSQSIVFLTVLQNVEYSEMSFLWRGTWSRERAGMLAATEGITLSR